MNDLREATELSLEEALLALNKTFSGSVLRILKPFDRKKIDDFLFQHVLMEDNRLYAIEMFRKQTRMDA